MKKQIKEMNKSQEEYFLFCQTSTRVQFYIETGKMFPFRFLITCAAFFSLFECSGNTSFLVQKTVSPAPQKTSIGELSLFAKTVACK